MLNREKAYREYGCNRANTKVLEGILGGFARDVGKRGQGNRVTGDQGNRVTRG
jgi:hypothetical protein